MSATKESIRIFWSGYLDFPSGNYNTGTKIGQPMTGEFDPKMIDLESVSDVEYSVDAGKIGVPTLSDFSFTIKNRRNDTGDVIFSVDDIVNLGRTKEYGGRSIRRSDLFVKAYSNVLGREIFTGYIRDFSFTKRHFEITFTCESIFKLIKDESNVMKELKTRGATVGEVNEDTLNILESIFPLTLPQPNGATEYKGMRDLARQELNLETVRVYFDSDAATHNLDAGFNVDVVHVTSESDLHNKDIELESTIRNIDNLLDANRPTFEYSKVIGKDWSPRFRRWCFAYLVNEQRIPKEPLFSTFFNNSFSAMLSKQDTILKRMIDQDLRVSKFMQPTGNIYFDDTSPYKRSFSDIAVDFINPDRVSVVDVLPFITRGQGNEIIAGYEYAGAWRTGFLKVGEDTILTVYRHIYVSEERRIASLSGANTTQLRRLVGGIEFVHARNGNATFGLSPDIVDNANFDVLYERGRFLVGSQTEPLSAGEKVEVSFIAHNVTYDYDIGTGSEPDVRRFIASEEDRTIVWDGKFTNALGETMDIGNLISSEWIVIHGVRYKRVIDGNSIYVEPSGSEENKAILIKIRQTLDKAISNYLSVLFFFDTSKSIPKTISMIKDIDDERYNIAFISDLRHYYWVGKKIEEAITDLAFQQSLYVSQAPNGFFRATPRWYVGTLLPNNKLDSDFIKIERRHLGDDRGDDVSFGFDAFRIRFADALEINNIVGSSTVELKINEFGLAQNQFTNIDDFEPRNFRTTQLGVPTREGTIIGVNQKFFRRGIWDFSGMSVSDFVSDPITQSQEFIKALSHPARVKKTGFNFLGNGLFNPVKFDADTGDVVDDTDNLVVDAALESKYKNIEAGWYVYVKKESDVFELFLVQSTSVSVQNFAKGKVFMALELLHVGDLRVDGRLIDEFGGAILDENDDFILDETEV